MRIIGFLIVSSLLFSAFSCSTAPEFERDNENDPSGISFVPNIPSGANYSIDENVNVLLSWEDKTNFEDGYKIYKSLGPSNSFDLIAELDRNSTTFLDSSKELAFPTKYRIVSFSDTSESGTLDIDVNFGTVSNLNAEFSDNYEKLNISWNSNLVFHDGFYLSSISDNDSVYRVLKTVSPNDTQTSIPVPEIGFSHKFKLSPFRINAEDTTTFDTGNQPLVNVGPKGLSLELVNIDSIKVQWRDISDYEDTYEVLLSSNNGTEIFSTKKNEEIFYYSGSFNYQDNFEVTVRARKNNLYSTEVVETITLELQPVILDTIEHISESSLRVIISDPTTFNRAVEIFRKSEDSDYQSLGMIPKGINFFEDDGLNTENIYTYYVSAPLSKPSSSKKAYYRNTLTVLKKQEITNGIFAYPEPEFKRAVYSGKINSTNIAHVVFQLPGGKKEIRVSDLINDVIHSKIEINHSPIEVAFSPDESVIASLNNDSKTIYIIDTTSETITDTISFSNSLLRDINFLDSSSRIVASQRFLNQNGSGLSGEYKTISIDISSNSNEVTVIQDYSNDDIDIYLNSNRSKMIVAQSNSSELFIDRYTISSSEITLNERKIFQNNYQLPITFSPNLDTMLINTSQYQLSMVDLQSMTSVFENEYNMYNSNFFKNTTFLADGLLYIQDQYGSFLVDSKLINNEIIQDFGFCCNHSGRGVLWVDSNYLIDFRSSSVSGFNSFFSIYQLQLNWREVYNSGN